MNRTDSAETTFEGTYSDLSRPLPDFSTQADLVALTGLNAIGATISNPLAADANVIANYNAAVALLTTTVGANNLYSAANIGPLALQLATLASAYNPAAGNDLYNRLYQALNSNLAVFQTG